MRAGVRVVSAEIRVSEDPATEVAELLTEAAVAGGHVVLTGGSSPKRAYELAAERDADWSAATVWFSDERCVGPSHPESNFAMAERALLMQLSAGPQVVRMEGELGPDAGAGAYEAEVRSRLGGEPRWDLLLLGMGPDGHVASLFPGKPEVEERSRLVAGVPLAGMEPQVPRITLTLPAIGSARSAVMLITGEGKADTVARAFGEEGDRSLPAAMVDLRYGSLTVLLDQAAASKL
jgi:6-phosphogluconolactonase